MKRATSIADHELHAYVDGELDPQRHVEVETWLATHPQAAQRVREYQAIRSRLHQRFDEALAEPAGPPLTETGSNGYTLGARTAVVAGLMLVSGLTGWLVSEFDRKRDDSVAQTDLVQPAAFAHEIYSTDHRYPVEIPALQQASLDRWVSQRMHKSLSAPDLQQEGLTFIGGRLLPSTNRMAAQFMYEDKQGTRVTVYVRRIAHSSDEDEFQYAEKDGLRVFYWINNAIGYAVIGEQPAERLIAIANAVQTALNNNS